MMAKRFTHVPSAAACVVLLALISLSCLASSGACQGDALTVSFASDGTWQTSAMNPDGSMGAVLGDAQCVCACAASCPPGATIYGHGTCWGADLSAIPGACWIWLPGVTGATTPADLQGAYISKDFNLAGHPVAGTILVGADDFAEVWINGSLIGSTGSISDYGLAAAAQGTLKTFDLTPFLAAGSNRITVLAQNGPSAFAAGCNPCSYSGNPAGVAFGGTLTYTAAVPSQGQTWGRIKAERR
jgi:hypothetical protein